MEHQQPTRGSRPMEIVYSVLLIIALTVLLTVLMRKHDAPPQAPPRSPPSSEVPQPGGNETDGEDTLIDTEPRASTSGYRIDMDREDGSTAPSAVHDLARRTGDAIPTWSFHGMEGSPTVRP